MNIADDLNSIRTHLEDDYKALKQLGVSVEDRNIENIKDMANQIYAKFPKTDYAEGSDITLSNTLKGKLDFESNIVGYAQTEQDSTQGYNLLNSAGGSVAYKPEGTITIDSKGVINASIDMSYASINIPSITLKTGKTYTFKRNFAGSRNSWFVDTNNNNVLGIGYNQTSATLTPESDIIINKLNGALLSGDNYFWLYEGTTDKDFESFTNGASPNPSYSQKIKVVRGKNKWGGFNKFTKTQGGLTFITNTDGSIDINGTATEICTSSTISEAIANNLFIKLEKGTYSVSGGGSNYVIQIYDKNANIIANTQLGTTSVTFTLMQTTEIMCRIFINSGDTQFNTKAQVQLEERKRSYSLSTL